MANNRYKSLRRSSEFQNLKDVGLRVRPCRWLILSYLHVGGQELQCGWTLSRKVANSVVRNRLKRWCREYFREESKKFYGYQLNVVFLPQPAGFFKNASREDILNALHKGCSKIRQHA